MQNPFLKQSLLLLARVAVLRLGMAGLMDDATLNQLVDALLTLGVVAWGLYEAFKQRQKLVTALASSVPMSEDEANGLVQNPSVITPSVTSAKDEIPQ